MYDSIINLINANVANNQYAYYVGGAVIALIITTLYIER